MKSIPVEELKAGMKFNKDVYLDGENLLVPAKVEIRQKDLDRLMKWGVEEVSTEGSPMTDEEVHGSETHSSDQGLSKKLLLEYHNSIDRMDSLYSDCRKGLKLDSEDINYVMTSFFPMILEDEEDSLILTTLRKYGEDPLAQASVNCLILSTVLCIKLKIPQHRMINIANAALIHDIGMTKIPQNIVKKQGKLTPAELEKVKTHTVYAYRMAIKDLGLPEETGRIAMSHHERWDGKGYPRGIQSSKIPVGGRILSVTDAFVAMMKDRPDRNSMLGYTAIRQILNDNSRRFDPAILKIFIQSIGIYPRGSIVILNSGAIGRIVKIRAAAPLRPGIQILIDEKGRKPKKENEIIDLFKEKDLFITKAVDPKELKKN